MKVVTATALVLALLVPSTACAEDDAPPKPRYYGWQTLTFDAPALGLLYGLHRSDDGNAASALRGVAIGTYALDGLVVHMAHGQPNKALASTALRTAVPGLGALGASFATMKIGVLGGGVTMGSGPAVGLGAIVGATVAALIDATALGWEASAPTEVSR
jgi:hypothetical protein